MGPYIMRRTLQGMLVLFLVSLTIFSLVRSLPGDAILMQLDQAAALSKEDLARARQELGLDRPFWQQYGTWAGGMLRGDLGRSLTSRKSVSEELGKRVTLTFHLAMLALGVGLLIAIPVGIVSAVWQDTVTDYSGRLLAIVGLSFPDFWLATVIITCMAIWWHWMPPMGFEPIWVDPLKCLAQLFIPAMIIGARLSAVLMRMTRSALLEVLREDYIRTARAKGLRERLVIGLVIAPGASRVVRGTVLSAKHNTYIDAARAAGASAWRIMLRHILPNVFAPILIIASVWLGNAIVIEAALSFLGLGTPPPTPTWGGMLSGEGRRSLETAPYLAIFPGLAISIVVLAFNMFGDAVRDLLDPRLRTP